VGGWVLRVFWVIDWWGGCVWVGVFFGVVSCCVGRFGRGGCVDVFWLMVGAWVGYIGFLVVFWIGLVGGLCLC